jgi:hypothetical protein
MRIFILAALLIAAFALPAHAVEPVKSAAKGTATVAKGALPTALVAWRRSSTAASSRRLCIVIDCIECNRWS